MKRPASGPNRLLGVSCFLVVVLPLCCKQVDAFEFLRNGDGTHQQWATNPTFVASDNESLYPSYIPDVNTFEIRIQQSLNRWSAVSTSTIAPSLVGNTSTPQVSGDSTNGIYFAALPPPIMGGAIPLVDGNGVLVEADIVLTTDENLLPDGRFDFTLVHEFGHCFGLHHTLQEADANHIPIMYPNARTQDDRLRPDDVAAISENYPEGRYFTDFGSISGVIHDANDIGVSGAIVVCVDAATREPVVSRFSSYLTGGTTAGGEYNIRGVPAGNYFVFVARSTASDGASIAGDLGPGASAFYAPVNLTFIAQDIAEFFEGETSDTRDGDTGEYPIPKNAKQVQVVPARDSANINFLAASINGLRMDPTSSAMVPGGSLLFQARGGTKPYAWNVRVNNSGATLDVNGDDNELLTYQAGTTENVRDILTLTDGLGASVECEISVFAGAISSESSNGSNVGRPGNATNAFLVDLDDDEHDDNCFIATASYGGLDEMAVSKLRRFRDHAMHGNRPGRQTIKTYYAGSPVFADLIRHHESLRAVARLMLGSMVH